MSKVLPSTSSDNPALADTSRYPTSKWPDTACFSATVLVIEDDEGVRHVTRRTLEAVGYQVLEAEDGEEGLRLIEEHGEAIDLVLTDIEMPRLDGISVVRALAAMHPRIGVVCMSGRMPEPTFHDRVGLPLPPFLTKPFSFDDLTRTASDTLARVRYLRT